MKTITHEFATPYTALTAAQRDAFIRRGNVLRAEAFARALSALVRPLGAHPKSPAGQERRRAA